MTWPSVPWPQAAIVSTQELRQADANALQRFGIQPLQLMEIAGWQVARFVNAFIGGVSGKRVLVVAGSGNNGGDALCAARFLVERAAVVQGAIVPPRDPNSLMAHHAGTLRQLGLTLHDASKGIDQAADVIIDGLFGTGVRAPLREPAPLIITAMNASPATVVSIDVPSGMDADDARGAEQAVQAAATLTLAAPKAGLVETKASGRIFLADIGMPLALFSTAGPALQRIFSIADVVELLRN
jgi:NAD(P)H-hydrate epimerase